MTQRKYSKGVMGGSKGPKGKGRSKGDDLFQNLVRFRKTQLLWGNKGT